MRYALSFGRAMLMGNNEERAVNVKDNLMRGMLGVIGSISLLMATWFANQVQKNAVDTSVLTQRITAIETQFPKQIAELKSDMRNEFTDIKEMIRRLPTK